VKQLGSYWSLDKDGKGYKIHDPKISREEVKHQKDLESKYEEIKEKIRLVK
jgi:hypothetical protein